MVMGEYYMQAPGGRDWTVHYVLKSRTQNSTQPCPVCPTVPAISQLTPCVTRYVYLPWNEPVVIGAVWPYGVL